jgi:hypothetical protein
MGLGWGGARRGGAERWAGEAGRGRGGAGRCGGGRCACVWAVGGVRVWAAMAQKGLTFICNR